MGQSSHSLKATVQDLEEIQKIINTTKSPLLKKALEEQYILLRGPVVTSILSILEKKEQDEIIEEIIEQEVTIDIDLDEEATLGIKGYKAKLNSLKETGMEVSYETLRWILLKCKGNEEKSLELLLNGDYPEVIPKNMTTETSMVKKKVKRVIKKEIKKPEPDSTEFRVQRIKDLRAMLETKRLEVQKLDMSKNLNISFESKDQERLYLPGEFEALQGEDTRIFTFKQERCVSNEVSFVHYRVAESEFYRLLGTQNALQVHEVKYLCIPQVVRAFEMARAQIAHTLGKNFKDIKPVLTFSQISSSDDYKEIIEKGLRDTKEGYFFSEDPNYASSFINQGKKLMLFLILPGKSQKSDHCSSEKSLKTGYHAARSHNGLEYKIWNTVQIMPYYLVSYGSPKALNVGNINLSEEQQKTSMKLLDDQFEDMKKEAVDDKFMDDAKRFYQESLVKKQKERSMGVMDGSDIMFQKIYEKRMKNEVLLTGEDLMTPGSATYDPFEKTPTSSGTEGGDDIFE